MRIREVARVSEGEKVMEEKSEREIGEGGNGKGRKEEGKKRGRPTNVERLGRERVGSMGMIQELIGRGKRKEREEEHERQRVEEEEVFRKSRRMERTPEKGGMDKWELEKMFRQFREGLREDMMKEMERMSERIERKMEEGREEMRRQQEKMEEKWEEEKREMRKRMEELERKVEDMKMEVRRGEKDEESDERVGGGEGREKEIARRMREIEVRLDKKEREKGRVNVIVKGAKVEGRRVEEVEEIWEQIGIKESVREVRRVGGMNREVGNALVKLQDIENKRKVMEARKLLKGRRERIEDDLTMEERRARWKIEREAEREREKGRRVQGGIYEAIGRR